jgi:hypothetical protein
MNSFEMNVNQLAIRNIEKSCEDYGAEVVRQLSKIYKFNAEEALAQLGLVVKISTKSSKKSKETRGDSLKKENVKPKVVLPFCGEKKESWCNRVKLNHGLYTQCTNEIKNEDGTCQTCGKKEGKLGTIDERISMSNSDFESTHKVRVTNFDKIMTKLNISKSEAESEASNFGWTIAKEQFEVQKSHRGRPKKSVIVSDSDDESQPKKGRGRPKKEKKVIESTNTGDDLIATLVANALQADSSASSSDDESASSADEETQSSLSEQAKLGDALETVQVEQVIEATSSVEKKPKKKRAPKKTAEEKEAEKAAKKAEKEAEKAAKKAEKAAEKEAEKAAKKAEKAAEKEAKKAEKAAKKSPTLTVEIPESGKEVEIKSAEIKVEVYSDDDEIKDLDDVISSDNEDDNEEDVEVVKFEYNSVTYLKTAEGILYDEETQDVVGKWNDELKCIEEYSEDSESEAED